MTEVMMPDWQTTMCARSYDAKHLRVRTDLGHLPSTNYYIHPSFSLRSSIQLSIYIYMTVCLSVCLSVYPSISEFFHTLSWYS